MSSLSHEPTRALVIQLISGVDELLDFATKKKIDTMVETCPEVNWVLWCVESILKEGIMTGFFGIKDVWDYCRCLVDCAPGTDSVIDRAKQIAKTSLGRVRMFIRISLNENSLADYLNALAWNKPLTEQFYEKYSIIRDVEEFGLVIDAIKRLSDNLQFILWIKDVDGVDDPRYWEITKKKRDPKESSNNAVPPVVSEPIVLNRSNNLLPTNEQIGLTRSNNIIPSKQIKNGQTDQSTPNISESTSVLEQSTESLNSPQSEVNNSPPENIDNDPLMRDTSTIQSLIISDIEYIPNNISLDIDIEPSFIAQQSISSPRLKNNNGIKMDSLDVAFNYSENNEGDLPDDIIPSPSFIVNNHKTEEEQVPLLQRPTVFDFSIDDELGSSVRRGFHEDIKVANLPELDKQAAEIKQLEAKWLEELPNRIAELNTNEPSPNTQASTLNDYMERGYNTRYSVPVPLMHRSSSLALSRNQSRPKRPKKKIAQIANSTSESPMVLFNLNQHLEETEKKESKEKDIEEESYEYTPKKRTTTTSEQNQYNSDKPSENKYIPKSSNNPPTRSQSMAITIPKIDNSIYQEEFTPNDISSPESKPSYESIPTKVSSPRSKPSIETTPTKVSSPVVTKAFNSPRQLEVVPEDKQPVIVERKSPLKNSNISPNSSESTITTVEKKSEVVIEKKALNLSSLSSRTIPKYHHISLPNIAPLGELKESLHSIQTTQPNQPATKDYNEYTINLKFDNLFKQPRNEFDDFSSSSYYTPMESASFTRHSSYRAKRPIWQQDKSRDTCCSCSRRFTFFRRRHHCRKCGKLFCGDCCKSKIPLVDLNYNNPVLVCNNCKISNIYL